MGFGSYDESEQQNMELNTEDEAIEGESAHENDHEGEVTFESGASTTDLVDRLADIRSESEEE